MVNDSEKPPAADASDVTIHTEIKTDVQYDEQGKTLAVQTVEQGKRRLDWRVGFKNGSFAEAHDLYFDEELLHSPTELGEISEWPSGKLTEENEFLPLEDMVTDSDGDIHREYGDAQDGVALAIQIIESEDPQTILNEWWEDMKEMHDNGAL